MKGLYKNDVQHYMRMKELDKLDTSKVVGKQEYTSKDTCINTVSAIYKYIYAPNAKILDYGGGKYDTNAEYMKKKCNADVLVYDPFNRSVEHNNRVRGFFFNCKAKIVVCSNVLCVIKEDEIIKSVLINIKQLMALDGVLYIKVYERNRSGIGCVTKKGWQRNQRTDEYIPLIREVFGMDYNIIKKNGLLIVKHK